jgi:acyl dehydratase
VSPEPLAGDALPRREFGPLTRTDIVRYQGASGDLNPIHHDDEYARSAGYPSAFSVGMLQAGMLATYITDLFGAENVRSYSVQFREQVWPGDVLVAEGQVETIAPDTGLLAVAVTLKRLGGGIAIRGTAEVLPAARSLLHT